MATHRYWRIYINSTAGVYCSFNEIELRDAFGGADRTGSGTAFSSFNLSGWPPSQAVDNNTTTGWATYNQAAPQWWAYNFGSGVAYDIIEIYILPRQDSFYGESPGNFNWQYSDDGTNWITVVTKSAVVWPTSAAQVFNVSPPTPTLIFADSFDHYSTADIPMKWTAANSATISAGTGRGGSASMRLSGSVLGGALNVPNLVTVYVGFAVKIQNGGNSMALLRLWDGGNIQVDLGLTSGNFMKVNRGSGTTVATATTGALSTGVFYYVESRLTFHGSAGIAEVRVDGTTVIGATGLNLITSANAYTNSVNLLSGAGSGNYDFDDFYIATDGFCGDVRVLAQMPTGAGNYSNWTPSTGLGWQCVDEPLMNSDTDYVSSGTNGHKSTFTFPALTLTGTMKELQYCATVRKDDAGTHTVRPVLGISGVDYFGTTVAISSGYAVVRESFLLNPATSLPWTDTEINATELGLEIVS